MNFKTEFAIKQKRKYAAARGNVIVMLVLTLVNLVTIFVDIGFYFPFSASFPFFLLIPESMSIFTLVLTILIFAAYFACWMMSKKYYAPMVVLLVLFGIDCAILFMLTVMSFMFGLIIDIAFHAWVMYYLVAGVVAGSRLKTLTPLGVAAEPKDFLNHLGDAEDRGSDISGDNASDRGVGNPYGIPVNMNQILKSSNSVTAAEKTEKTDADNFE